MTWKKLKTMLTKNLSLKITALCIAAILWLVVVNIQNPQKTVEFTATARIENETIIKTAGKVYEIEKDSNVIHFTVTGPRTLVESLSVRDFNVVADMERINMETGLIPVSISYTRSSKSDSLKIETQNNNVTVKIQNLAIKQFAVSTSSSGTPKNGYAVGNVSCYPATVTISGPEDTINSIEKVVAVIDINDMYDDRTQTIIPTMLSAMGEKIATASLTIEPSTVQVTAEILETKTVPLAYAYEGKVPEGFSLEKQSIVPEEILVKGRRENLSNLTKIIIPSDAIDLSKDTGTIEKVIDIIPCLPAGVELVDDDLTTVVIKSEVRATVSKTFEVPVTYIDVFNLPDDYKVAFASDTVKVEATGSQRVIDKLTSGSFGLSIDFDGEGLGNFTVNPKSIDIEGIDKILVHEISGTITEKNDGNMQPLDGNDND